MDRDAVAPLLEEVVATVNNTVLVIVICTVTKIIKLRLRIFDLAIPEFLLEKNIFFQYITNFSCKPRVSSCC